MGVFRFVDNIIKGSEYPWGFKYLIELIKTITTQSDWQEGSLTGVVADSGDYLRLAEQYALEFDRENDEYVEVPHDDAFNVSELSLCGWMNLYNLHEAGIISRWTEEESYALDYGNNANQDDLRLVLSIDGTTEILQVSEVLASNAWLFCVGTWDGSTMKLYVNANEEGSKSVAGTLAIVDTRILFGVNAGTSLDNSLDGLLSELRIYNRALSGTEIQGLYEGQNVTDGLIGYWPMNEGEGTTVYDESTNNNDGTIESATWTSGYTYPPTSGEGTRTSPPLSLDNIKNVTSSEISWTSTEPTDTNITIECAVNEDSETEPSDYTEATSGQAIPGISENDDLTGKYLWVRQTLSTSDPSTTPELDELKIEVYA